LCQYRGTEISYSHVCSHLFYPVTYGYVTKRKGFVVPWRIEWIEPEIFLQHNGVTVYHAYKNNDVEQKFTYWFTTNPEYYEEFGGEADPYEFDVRDLNTPPPDNPQLVIDALTPPASELEEMAATIRRAIDLGILETPDGDAS